MSRRRNRGGLTWAMVLATVFTMLFATAFAASAAPSDRRGQSEGRSQSEGHAQAEGGDKAYAAYSHDLKTYLLGTIDSGPLVAAGVGCSSTPPLYFSNAGADLSLAGVTVGAVTTTSQGLKSGDVQEARSTSTLENVRLPLGVGALTADSLVISSSTFYNTVTGAFSTASTMTAADLEVRLNPLLPPIISINGTVQPNTGFDLGALGQLTLHDSEAMGDAAYGAVGQLTRGVYLEVLGSTSIAIGENYTSLYGEADQSYMFGAGEGVRVATSDDTLAVGPLVTAQLPCTGTGGLAAEVVSTPSLPAALGGLGVVTSTANGDREGLNSNAETTSGVADVNLLGGLITADAVGSQAVAVSTDGGATVDTSGSGSNFVNLMIAGVPINANVAPNTQITVPGVGYVTLNEQYTYSVGADVRALTVHVTAGNTLGLPTLEIIVGRSYAVLYGPGSTTGQLRQVDRLMSRELDKSEKLEHSERPFTDGTLEGVRVLPEEVTVSD